jgi:hypothetical protein
MVLDVAAKTHQWVAPSSVSSPCKTVFKAARWAASARSSMIACMAPFPSKMGPGHE